MNEETNLSLLLSKIKDFPKGRSKEGGDWTARLWNKVRVWSKEIGFLKFVYKQTHAYTIINWWKPKRVYNDP